MVAMRTSALRSARLLCMMAAAMGTASFAGDVPPGQLKNPDFVAHLDALQSEIPSASPATGEAWFWLDRKEPGLHYRIELEGLDLTSYVTCSQPIPGCDPAMSIDDVTGIHFHVAPPGISGPHVLNVYRAPSDDDADLALRPHAGVVRGRWDDGDENRSLPVPSRKLSEFIGALCDGNIYIAVHTTEYPMGAIRGQVIPSSRACEKRD